MRYAIPRESAWIVVVVPKSWIGRRVVGQCRELREGLWHSPPELVVHVLVLPDVQFVQTPGEELRDARLTAFGVESESREVNEARKLRYVDQGDLGSLQSSEREWQEVYLLWRECLRRAERESLESWRKATEEVANVAVERFPGAELEKFECWREGLHRAIISIITIVVAIVFRC